MSTVATTRRVLVVDDHADIQDVMRRILASSSGSSLAEARAALFGSALARAPTPRFAVDAALQGEEGLARVVAARAEGHPYLLAFVDMRMPPGWDGLETTSRILKADPEIYVVICTAYSDASLEQIHARLGNTERVLVLKKPFDPIEIVQLANALSERWLSRRAAADRSEQLDQLVRDKTAEIQDALLHDGLTGLPNRTLFAQRLETAIAAHRADPDRRFAVVFLDLDRFKQVNDTFGHEWGDRLLVEVADRLRGSLRSQDHLTHQQTPARLAGDEFLILLEGLAPGQDVSAIAERLLASVSQPCMLGGQPFRVTASMGIVTSDRPYTSAAEMIRDADTAMYRAKAAGRARFAVFGQELREELASRLSVEAEVRGALEHGGFRLAYQPVVRLRDRQQVGFEALLRLRAGTLAGSGATRVVAIAEDTGLIHPLGRWVVSQALRDAHAWAGDLRVHINVSPRQLVHPDLPEVIRDMLVEAGLPPERLAVEVTEAGLLADPPLARRALDHLAELGLRLFLDDFGAGLGCVQHLSELGLAGVKLDPSFLARIGEDPRHERIVAGVVELAHGCGLEVIAEGVESEAQLNRVRAIGCDAAQGFWLGVPTEVEPAAVATAQVEPAGEAPPTRRSSKPPTASRSRPPRG